MSKSRRMAWILAAVVVTVGAICTTAMGADAQPTIAIVDLERVHRDAPRMKQYLEEIGKFKQSLEQKLDIRIQNMMLQETEIQELITLKTKDKRSDQENARVAELEKIERDRDGELKTLQSTKELDDAKKAKMAELQSIRKKSEDTGTALTKDYDAQLKGKFQELDAKAEADLREAIGQVAKAKGVSMVIAKDAILFGGADITDDVIGKLDRKVQ